MYGLSDKCPASVDKLSSLLTNFVLDFDSERVQDAVCGFHGVTQCDVTILWVALSTSQ